MALRCAGFRDIVARNVVTGTDGTANAIYTAPACRRRLGRSRRPALRRPISSHPSDAVTFATPHSHLRAAVSKTVAIRLVPPGVILPPAGTPKASFVVTPHRPQLNVAANFDASASCPTTDSSGNWCASVSSAHGVCVVLRRRSAGGHEKTTHALVPRGTFSVTLTVTNDRRDSAVDDAAGRGRLPRAVPTRDVRRVADGPVTARPYSSTGADRARRRDTRSSVGWDFGDGDDWQWPSSTTSHIYSQAGSYTVDADGDR